MKVAVWDVYVNQAGDEYHCLSELKQGFKVNKFPSPNLSSEWKKERSITKSIPEGQHFNQFRFLSAEYIQAIKKLL